MRHNAFGRKLGRTTSHRLALFRNQLASLVQAERIVTTLPKAKELRPLAERAVTQGKKAASIHARRLVARWLPDRELVRKLFEEIAPRFTDRPGGYTRIVKLGHRAGDGAEMAVLEFVDFDPKKKAAAAPAKGGEKKEASDKQAKAEEKTAKTEKKAAPKKPAKAATAKGGAKAQKAPSTARKTSTPKKVGSS